MIAECEEHRRKAPKGSPAGVGPAGADAGEDPLAMDAPDAKDTPDGTDAAGPRLVIASATDASGMPVHRGWAPAAGHHRWLEPFVLMALANGNSHGYAIIGALTDVGISGGNVDVGQVYRTLRDLEQAGQVRSTWATGTGAARRDYRITEEGSKALDEWAAVMKERARLIAEFDAAYLSWVFDHPQG